MLPSKNLSTIFPKQKKGTFPQWSLQKYLKMRPPHTKPTFPDQYPLPYKNNVTVKTENFQKYFFEKFRCF